MHHDAVHNPVAARLKAGRGYRTRRQGNRTAGQLESRGVCARFFFLLSRARGVGRSGTCAAGLIVYGGRLSWAGASAEDGCVAGEWRDGAEEATGGPIAHRVGL